jgi:hypothetical protein
VLAGALQGTETASEIIYSDDPFGVAYLVASLTVPPADSMKPATQDRVTRA